MKSIKDSADYKRLGKQLDERAKLVDALELEEEQLSANTVQKTEPHISVAYALKQAAEWRAAGLSGVGRNARDREKNMRNAERRYLDWMDKAKKLQERLDQLPALIIEALQAKSNAETAFNRFQNEYNAAIQAGLTHEEAVQGASVAAQEASGESAWYATWYGILGIIAVLVAAFFLIKYLLKK